MGKVYFMTDGEAIKIGYTSGNVFKRMKQLSTGCPEKLYLLGYITGTKKTEKQLHSQFERIRIRKNGEWFHGQQELIDYINAINEKEHVFIEKTPLTQNKITALTTMGKVIL